LKWKNSKYEKNYLNHFDLIEGGELNFDMISSPNLQRGTSPNNYPYSYSK
jgi:putative alpha-1,2-mannosidase